MCKWQRLVTRAETERERVLVTIGADCDKQEENNSTRWSLTSCYQTMSNDCARKHDGRQDPSQYWILRITIVVVLELMSAESVVTSNNRA
jgi:hypothetical protein